MELIDGLMKLGYTRHEASLYIVLCREGELTGYEASKTSGINRSNAYLALAGLVEKGGAYRIEGESVRYVAVPPKELAANYRRQMSEVLSHIEENVPVKASAKDSFVTITGKAQILNKMKNIIGGAVERIYLSTSHEVLESVRSELAEARVKGLKVVIITSEPFGLPGAVVHFHDKYSGQIRLITDTAHVLTGAILNDGTSTCIYSRNKNLVELIKDSLTNEIKLIELNKK